MTYSKKTETTKCVTDCTAASVLDSSAQNESLQRKADMANSAAQRAEAPRPNNTGMPDNLKAGIESLSGFSMDDVRVHYNSSKPATVQALAYTQGTDIHVAPGQEKHLPHEAWHVAQQMAGRVLPTTNINGLPVNDNAGLEHEADVMGEKAVMQRKGLAVDYASGKVQGSVAQRMAFYNPDSPTETTQVEGNEELAVKLGRHKGESRPVEVSRYVDQFKKEMLTYIASCIADCQEKDFYGPHISVVITGGVWYIAVNSDFVDSQKNVKKRLLEDAYAVQNEIVKKRNALEEKEGFIEQLKCETSNVPDDIAKKQALYIVYRWAGKGKGIVVEQNESRQNGVMHGEMQTIEILNNKVIAFRKAATCFDGVKGEFSDSDTEKSIELASFNASRAASCVDEAQIAKKAADEADKKGNVESDADCKAAVAAYYAAESAKDAKTASDEAEKKAESVVKFTEANAKKMADYYGEFDEYNRYSVDASYTVIKMIESYHKLKSACSIIDFQIESNEKRNGVVRVGGTKTPCYDCAYEMHVHEDHNAENEITVKQKDKTQKKCKVHSGHQAENIGGKKVVTMTPNFGNPYYNWMFKNDARPKGDSFAIEEFGFDDQQDQDYNELCGAFNSVFTDPNQKMQITSSMLDVWERRKTNLEKLKKTKNSIDLSCYTSLDLQNSLLLKRLIEKELNKICITKDVASVSNFDENHATLGNCLKKINDEKENVRKGKEKISDFVLYERLVINQLDVNVQNKIAENEFIRLFKEDDYGNNLSRYQLEYELLVDLNKMNQILESFYKLCDKSQKEFNGKSSMTKNNWNSSSSRKNVLNYDNLKDKIVEKMTNLNLNFSNFKKEAEHVKKFADGSLSGNPLIVAIRTGKIVSESVTMDVYKADIEKLQSTMKSFVSKLDPIYKIKLASLIPLNPQSVRSSQGPSSVPTNPNNPD